MNFTHYDLGNLGKGRIVEIILQGNAANVQLMDSSNFNNYRNGRQYRYIGGLAKKSPVRLQTTHSGHWHVAIDLRGMRGNVRSSVRVLPEALPEIRQLPLNTVPSLIHNRGLGIDFDVDTTPEYDVFISHASEDKDEVVRPLATALRDKGVKVWYDEFEMKIGDSLVDEFRRKFGNDKMVFSDRSLENKDLSYLSDDTIKNNYIRPQLRLSSVTIVLIGAETGGRWWVDWEIYCSLRKSAGNERNGILGILIPNKQHNIPQRILDNPDNSEIITMPKSAKELEDAIERVYLKRYHAPNLARPLRQRNSHI